MDILTAVILRLTSLGYTVLEADSAMIDYDVVRAEDWLKANLNQAEVPNNLFYVWADMAAGLFLVDKKAAGQLPDHHFEAPVKSISEGDTSVAFAVGETGTAERQFDAMLAKLIHPDEAILATFRRVAW